MMILQVRLVTTCNIIRAKRRMQLCILMPTLFWRAVPVSMRWFMQHLFVLPKVGISAWVTHVGGYCT